MSIKNHRTESEAYNSFPADSVSKKGKTKNKLSKVSPVLIVVISFTFAPPEIEAFSLFFCV